MTDWIKILYRELDEWNYDGVAATLWWRDDDAQTASAELDWMLDLAQKYDAPLNLAVIPRGLNETLTHRLQSLATVTVLQHGFSHDNYAPADEKKMELGAHRPAAAVHQELANGFNILHDTFGAQFLPVLVPPWNRIATPLLAGLAQTGFGYLSTFAPRAEVETVGLRTVNTHVDIIDWKKNKSFIGAHRASEAMVAHLKGRRLGHFDGYEPTGLLTHHLVHDDGCRKFLAHLLAALDEHPAAKWLCAEDVFGLARRQSRPAIPAP